MTPDIDALVERHMQIAEIIDPDAFADLYDHYLDVRREHAIEKAGRIMSGEEISLNASISAGSEPVSPPEEISALTRLSEENARLREALAAGTRECEQCHGGGEVFGHAADCDNDLCALAGGIDDCLGRVDPCGACDGTGRAALQGDA